MATVSSPPDRRAASASRCTRDTSGSVVGGLGLASEGRDGSGGLDRGATGARGGGLLDDPTSRFISMRGALAAGALGEAGRLGTGGFAGRTEGDDGAGGGAGF